MIRLICEVSRLLSFIILSKSPSKELSLLGRELLAIAVAPFHHGADIVPVIVQASSDLAIRQDSPNAQILKSSRRYL